jgi:hypothetical protein
VQRPYPANPGERLAAPALRSASCEARTKSRAHTPVVEFNKIDYIFLEIGERVHDLEFAAGAAAHRARSADAELRADERCGLLRLRAMKAEPSVSRMASATVAAVAVHSLALVGLVLTRPPEPSAAIAVNAPELIEVSIEAKGEQAAGRIIAPSEPPLPKNVEPRVRARAPDNRAPDKGRDVSDSPPASSEAASTAGVEEPMAAGPPPDWSFNPGLNIAPPARAPSAAIPPPLVPRATPVPSGVLGPQVDARGNTSAASGSALIISTVRDIANQDVPRNGYGTIRIEVDSAGTVTRVTTTVPSWDKALRSIQASLTGRRVRVPSSARGLVITLAVDAETTSVPRVLTGETKAAPCSKIEKDQAGRLGGLPDPGCVDVMALLPILRRRISVKLLSEQVL